MKIKLLCLFLVLNLYALSQDYIIDSAFGTNGRVISNFSFPNLSPSITRVQSDGKIITAGVAGFNGQDDIIIMRYNSNGTVDNSFSGDGVLTIDISNQDESLNALTLSGDKIFIAGSNYSTGPSGFVIKLNADGSFDNSFGSGGRVNFAKALDDVQVASNGRIVVLSETYNFSTSKFALLRLNADGSTDNSFGSSGKIDVAVDYNGNLYAYNVVLLNGGKFLIGGETFSSGSNESALMALQLNANGTADANFNGTGLYISNRGEYNEYFGGIQVLAGNTILLSGYAQEQSLSKFEYTKIIKLNANGSYDNTFNGTGVTQVNTSTGFVSLGRPLLQSDGKMLIGGMKRGVNNYSYALARVNANGGLDNSFGSSGFASFPEGTGNSYGFSLDLQSGKPVLFGGSFNGTKYVFSLARFNTNGTPDNGFGSSGIITKDAGTGKNNASVLNALLLSDGKFLVASQYYNGTANSLLISKYSSNGLLDNTFGNAGHIYIDVISDLFSTDQSKNKILGVQSNGKIIVSYPYYDIINGIQLEVQRFNANGTADNSFGTVGKTTISPDDNIVPAGIYNTLVQSDDKILNVVYGLNTDEGLETYSIVRLTNNGVLDNSFDGDGKKLMTFPVNCLAQQGDGKIIAAGGQADQNTFLNQIALTRLNANGTADNGFNSGNVVVFNDVNSLNDMAGFVNLASNGIIVTGSHYILKYKNDGTLDNSFGDANSGASHPDIPTVRTGVGILSSGKIMITGSGDVLGESAYYIAPLSSNGIADYSYGNASGWKYFDIVADNNDDSYSMQLQTNDNIIMAGKTTPPFSSTPSLNIENSLMVRLKPKPITAVIYTFTGNGNFSNAANWQTGQVPPSEITSGMEIIINPPANSQCILDVPLTIKPGGKISILQQKQFVIKGNLIIN